MKIVEPVKCFINWIEQAVLCCDIFTNVSLLHGGVQGGVFLGSLHRVILPAVQAACDDQVLGWDTFKPVLIVTDLNFRIGTHIGWPVSAIIRAAVGGPEQQTHQGGRRRHSGATRCE